MNSPEVSNNSSAPAIVSIELTPVFLPFREFVRQTMESGAGGLGMAIRAEEKWLGGDFVICKLTCEDGSCGLGEAFVWLPETGGHGHPRRQPRKSRGGKYFKNKS